MKCEFWEMDETRVSLDPQTRVLRRYNAYRVRGNCNTHESNLNCRYIAVTQPIKYAKHKNNRRVWLTILLVWAISAAIGSPIVLGLNNTPDRIPDQCLFYNTDFIIYSSLSSFYIPCIIMVFLYYNIFKVRKRLSFLLRKYAIVWSYIFLHACKSELKDMYTWCGQYFIISVSTHIAVIFIFRFYAIK